MCVRRMASEILGAGSVKTQEAVLRYGLDRQNRRAGGQ